MNTIYPWQFVVFVDTTLSDDDKELVLTSASELFCVKANFDSECTDDGGDTKWINIEGENLENMNAAKLYIIACFNPRAKCTLRISPCCCDLLVDAFGLWWRSLEHGFKIRMCLSTIGASKEQEEFAELTIQGEQDAVGFANSYITDLDKMMTCPPDEPDMDNASVRRKFTNELTGIPELRRVKYLAYNPYVLRTLLKWIYFVKGAKPPDDSYVLYAPKYVDKSVIVLHSDDEDMDENELANIIGNAALDDDSRHGTIDPKRKMEQCASSSAIGGNGSGDEIDILEAAALAGHHPRGIPVQLPNKATSNKRFAFSTSPLGRFVANQYQSNFVQLPKEAEENIARIPTFVIPDDKFANVDFAQLRPVIIDGSNVALEAGRNRRFNCRGILLAIRTFIEHGHRVLAFVPDFRMDQHQYQHLLDKMVEMGVLVLTPRRRMIHTTSKRTRYRYYGDNMIVQYAHKSGGVILSNGNYREVATAHPEYAPTIADRLLTFAWVGEELMLPEDPHGKNSPPLDEVLRFQRNETVQSRKEPMDEKSCRELLQRIHVELHTPAPSRQRRHSFV